MNEKERNEKIQRIYQNSVRFHDVYFQVEKLNGKLNAQEKQIEKLRFDLSRVLGIVLDIAKKLDVEELKNDNKKRTD